MMDEKLSVPEEEHFLQHQQYHQQICDAYLVVQTRLRGHFDTLLNSADADLKALLVRMADSFDAHLHKRAVVHDELVRILREDFASFHQQDVRNAQLNPE